MDNNLGIKIGLETHIQLNTASKIFCGCANPARLKEDREPNSLVCPTCLGLPGSKPAANAAVVDAGIKVGLALNAQVAARTHFSRKTYFYPDMAKNFQISQYEVPLASGGMMEVNGKKIRIKRVHMEEDPAKIQHVGGLGGYTLVDYNRAGIPLLEIVTEPDFQSPEEAREYVQKLAAVAEYLGLYDPATKAVIKSDANISLKGGERVEVKNITGTKEVETALHYEIVRQKNALQRGPVTRETRSWNPERGSTENLRGKEAEEEYGYIFEPDLPVLEIGNVENIRKTLPELPDQKKARYIRQFSLSEKTAEALTAEPDIALLFEHVARQIPPELAASWIAGELKKTLNWNGLRWKEAGLKPEWITDILRIYKAGKLTDRNAELCIRKMVEEKLPPAELIQKYGLGKEAVDIGKVVEKLLEGNKKAVEDYKKGNQKALEFLVGLALRETKGKVDANQLRKALESYLSR